MQQTTIKQITTIYRLIAILVLLFVIGDAVYRWITSEEGFLGIFLRLLYGVFWAVMIFAAPRLISGEWAASLPKYVWQFSPPRILGPVLWGLIFVIAVCTFIVSALILAFYYVSNIFWIIVVSFAGTVLIMLPLTVGITQVYYQMTKR